MRLHGEKVGMGKLGSWEYGVFAERGEVGQPLVGRVSEFEFT